MGGRADKTLRKHSSILDIRHYTLLITKALVVSSRHGQQVMVIRVLHNVVVIVAVVGLTHQLWVVLERLREHGWRRRRMGQ